MRATRSRRFLFFPDATDALVSDDRKKQRAEEADIGVVIFDHRMTD